LLTSYQRTVIASTSSGDRRPRHDILEAICQQFREMAPHGVENYGGGGSGFAVMPAFNFIVLEALAGDLNFSGPASTCTLVTCRRSGFAVQWQLRSEL